MIRSCLFLLLLFICIPALPQTGKLPIPRDIQEAYDKGFRSLDGRPGPNYFVNRARYQIEARVNPENSELTGTETITYYNNSSQVLKRILVNLYQNLYRPGSVLDMPLGESSLGEGVMLTGMRLGSDSVSLEGDQSPVSVSGTILTLQLPKPLSSGDSIELQISWKFQLPAAKTLRMGKYGEDNFFFAYWYPQVAVFDDLSGWDRVPFTGLQEFYQEFGDFDVALTLPEDYIVWATGELQNPKEVLAEPFLSRYLKARESDEVIRIIRQEEVSNGGFTPDQDQVTWRFQAKDVPDFAFGTSSSFRWDGASVVLDSTSGKRVYADAGYPENQRSFSDVAAISREVLLYLSQDLPGVPYPYPKVSVFNGIHGGGMEYPMMANDQATNNAMYTYNLTCHEIAHTFYPFYTGLNEQKYAWMDEGLASFLGSCMVRDKGLLRQAFRFPTVQFGNLAGKEADVPLMMLSYQKAAMTYYTHAYAKAPVAFAMLEAEMGSALFRQALQEFTTRWAGKHPSPCDLFFTFNDVAGEDYSWFWKPWFFETTYPDLGIASATLKGKSGKILISNPGGLPLPIHLQVTLDSGKRKTLLLPPSVWREGNATYEMKLKFEEEIQSVRLGDPEIPDINPKNNKP